MLSLRMPDTETLFATLHVWKAKAENSLIPYQSPSSSDTRSGFPSNLLIAFENTFSSVVIQKIIR